jgi:hypothetical protein
MKRMLLTSQTVREIVPPAKGEIWVSDTVIKGFGLRLWKNPSGKVGGAYSIRIKDEDGNSRRQTFELWRDYLFPLDYFERREAIEKYHDAALHELADIARLWAKDAVERILRKLPSYEAEKAEQLRAINSMARSATLEQVAVSTLKNMRAGGVSQAYFDRLYKLFFANFPSAIRSKPVDDLKGENVWQRFNSNSILPGNARVLRPFVRRVFSNYHELAGGQNKLERAYEPGSLGANEEQCELPEISNWGKDEFIAKLDLLLDDDDHWQQGYCLRLFLSISHAPLSRFMAAKWEDIGIVSGTSYYSRQKKEIYVWPRNKNFRWVSFRGKDEQILLDLFRKCKLESDQVQYLFPSVFGRHYPHIRSVDHVWRRWLHGQKIPYVSPIKFRDAYERCRLKNRWYWDFLYD